MSLPGVEGKMGRWETRLVVCLALLSTAWFSALQGRIFLGLVYRQLRAVFPELPDPGLD